MGIAVFRLAIVLALSLTLVLAELAYSQDMDEDEQLESEMDDLYASSIPRDARRFLGATYMEPQPGAICDTKKPKVPNICDGILTKNDTALLLCCQHQCRDILNDVNNCGECGGTCKFGQLCCAGRCKKVSNNKNHCGACYNKCKKGRACENGICGRRAGKSIVSSASKMLAFLVVWMLFLGWLSRRLITFNFRSAFVNHTSHE